MNQEELQHYGIKGMKWGVRRSKAQLARLSGRKKEDISDEEAEKFKKDVRRTSMLDRSPTKKLQMYNKMTVENGRDYARAVLKQASINKTINTVAGTVGVAAGKMAVEAYSDYKLGAVHFDNGTTLYTKPRK